MNGPRRPLGLFWGVFRGARSPPFQTAPISCAVKPLLVNGLRLVFVGGRKVAPARGVNLKAVDTTLGRRTPKRHCFCHLASTLQAPCWGAVTPGSDRYRYTVNQDRVLTIAVSVR